MHKVMITGATGLLGRAIYRTLENSFSVIGCGFSRAQPPFYSLNLSDRSAVEVFLDTHQPNALIHAAAERRPDVCETDHAATLALNVEATQFLAACCAQRGIRLFFISTDYVFDGNDAPYSEQATPNPVNFYGQTKLAGEQQVLAASGEHCVIRVPVLYGQVNELTESAVTIIAEHLQQDANSPQDNWAIRYPTHVDDIAATLGDMLRLAVKGGIYHISGDQALTKYQMAQAIATAINVDAKAITAQDSPSSTATRPYNCALKDNKLHQLGISHQRDFNTAIQNVLAPHIVAQCS
ncbi:dTDP-4-dehydrorhamnose reductase family protein [Pseudoalteromonas sp. T1lg65]|uniref:dTDP-4-dehydrorhamnose reductase family protein n=1 Tax=Pseudoalteromonas sp. T1lg65 TaxID=2077101 RepID=UPI003F7B04A4